MAAVDFFSDVELVRLHRAGNTRALPILVTRHERLARSCVRPYFIPGGDADDLLQEARVGLTKAVRDYDTASGTPFRAFAELCVTRQVISAVQGATRAKHAALNESVRFSLVVDGAEGDGGEEFGERLPGPSEDDPARAAAQTDALRALCSFLDSGLTEVEASVLAMFLGGRGYEEIAMRLDCSAKRVDNTMQRVRGKVASFKGWGQLAA